MPKTQIRWTLYVRVVCVCGTPFRRQLLQNNSANQQRGLTAFTKADLLQSVDLASNHLPLVNNLSRNRQSFVTNIRDRENEGRTAAEEGMFTSTRKICFVLCGGRGTAIPRGRTEAQRGLAAAAAWRWRRRPGRLSRRGSAADRSHCREGLDLMSDNDAKCIAETPKPWDGCARNLT